MNLHLCSATVIQKASTCNNLGCHVKCHHGFSLPYRTVMSNAQSLAFFNTLGKTNKIYGGLCFAGDDHHVLNVLLTLLAERLCRNFCHSSISADKFMSYMFELTKVVEGKIKKKILERFVI